MTGLSRVQPMAATAHTPTPWRVETECWIPWEGAIGILPHDLDEDNAIAWTASGDTALANAALIVEAVNNFEALKALHHSFRAADEIDWQHLMSFLPDSGHGKFWKAVFAEVRSALNPAPEGK